MNEITGYVSQLAKLLPAVPGFRNEGVIALIFIVIVGAFVADYIKRRRRHAEAPVDVGPEDPPSFLRALFFTLLLMGTVISFAGVLFVPTAAWSQLGMGLGAGFGVLAFLYGLRRYKLGLWRNNPKQTLTRARLGLVALPFVAAFALWATLVLTGGAIYTGLAGTPETLAVTLSKHLYHDRYGDHRCLKSPAFGDNFLSDLFGEFCGIDDAEFEALPPHFAAVLDIRRSGLGYLVISYHRR